MFCKAVPTDVTGPSMVGMSNILLDDDDDVTDVDSEDGRRDESVGSPFGRCVNVAGGGFCGGAGAGEQGCLDMDGGAVNSSGAGAGTGAGEDAGLDVGAVEKLVWGVRGKVESGAYRSDVCIITRV